MRPLPSFGFGKHRGNEEALRERITALQTALNHCNAALNHCNAMARRWTELPLGAFAIVFLALGFALGFYHEPILRTARDLAGNLGISRKTTDADALNAAHQKGDCATVLRLARPLADAGNARAQFMLALRYYRGRCETRNYQEAAKWFRRAADQGDSNAQFFLGMMSAEGEGIPQDHAEAAQWFSRAADRGDPEAQYNLGLAYATGIGVPQDNVSAHMWFNLATAHFPASDTRRITAGTNRDALAKQMTRDQIAEAQKRAREWRPQ